jgi:ligand-binding SRPBCC domain-containing protein
VTRCTLGSVSEVVVRSYFFAAFDEASGTSARIRGSVRPCRTLTPPTVTIIEHRQTLAVPEAQKRRNRPGPTAVGQTVTTQVFESKINATVERVWAFHSSVEALKTLTPPGQSVEIIGEETAVREGALHVLRIRQGPLKMVWKARITGVTPPVGFTDTAEKSSFAFWQHRHEFVPDGEGTVLRDTVTYAVAFGPIGWLAEALFVRRLVARLFRHRHEATWKALAEHDLVKPDDKPRERAHLTDGQQHA